MRQIALTLHDFPYLIVFININFYIEFLEKSNNGLDGRFTYINLTAKGNKVLSKIFPHWRKAQEQVKKILGEELDSVIHVVTWNKISSEVSKLISSGSLSDTEIFVAQEFLDLMRFLFLAFDRPY